MNDPLLWDNWNSFFKSQCRESEIPLAMSQISSTVEPLNSALYHMIINFKTFFNDIKKDCITPLLAVLPFLLMCYTQEYLYIFLIMRFQMSHYLRDKPNTTYNNYIWIFSSFCLACFRFFVYKFWMSHSFETTKIYF